jgi:hypothetical protein
MEISIYDLSLYSQPFESVNILFSSGRGGGRKEGKKERTKERKKLILLGLFSELLFLGF